VRPADILPAVFFWILQRSTTAPGAQTKKSVFRLNHERFRWRVGNAELVFHEIQVDRALRRAMLFKALTCHFERSRGISNQSRTGRAVFHASLAT
jgi:hypothetical protein